MSFEIWHPRHHLFDMRGMRATQTATTASCLGNLADEHHSAAPLGWKAATQSGRHMPAAASDKKVVVTIQQSPHASPCGGRPETNSDGRHYRPWRPVRQRTLQNLRRQTLKEREAARQRHELHLEHYEKVVGVTRRAPSIPSS